MQGETSKRKNHAKVDPGRLYIKVTRENLPQVKDKYPFLYLEHGRLAIDDSSIKWMDSEGSVIRLPIATLNALLLGPGTTVTHEAVKVIAQTNCGLCWVGEDGLLFYACGQTPNSDTRNMREQIKISTDPLKALEVARRMFAKRFPKADLENKSLKEMMGMEGFRIRSLYEDKGKHYGVGWKGRRYTPGKFQLGDMTNRVLTSTNAALYGILSSAIHSMGYSPHIGFIHSGSPLPFVYDLADLYKENLCIDLAFSLTLELAGEYNKHKVSAAFRERVVESNLLGELNSDIKMILGVKNARSDR